MRNQHRQTFNPQTTPIRQAKNIGAISGRELEEVGIHTLEKLKDLGWKKAWARLIRFFPKRRNANMAYALVGAIKDCHWQHIPKKIRNEIQLHLKKKSSTKSKLRSTLKPK